MRICNNQTYIRTWITHTRERATKKTEKDIKTAASQSIRQTVRQTDKWTDRHKLNQFNCLPLGFSSMYCQLVAPQRMPTKAADIQQKH